MDDLTHEFDLTALAPLIPAQVFHLCVALHRDDVAGIDDAARWARIAHHVASNCPDGPPVSAALLRRLVEERATPFFPTPFHKYSLWVQVFCDPWFTFMNYGYAELGGAPDASLIGAETSWPYAAAMYRHVAGMVALPGTDVLEIACGRGGGAAYVTRTMRPRSYVASDGTRSNVRFCRDVHGHDRGGLRFVHARAEDLPFEEESFDVVLDVESCKYYASFPAFAAGVHRVLRPGGRLVLAFFDGLAGALAVSALLAAAGLTQVRVEDISANVVAAQTRFAQQDLVAMIAANPTVRPRRDYYELLAGAYRMDALSSGRARYYAGVWQKRVS